MSSFEDIPTHVKGNTPKGNTPPPEEEGGGCGARKAAAVPNGSNSANSDHARLLAGASFSWLAAILAGSGGKRRRQYRLAPTRLDARGG